MCFRIEQEEENMASLIRAIEDAFGETIAHETVLSSPNIGLTNEAMVLYKAEELRLDPMRFGLVPSWAKEPGAQLGNARSETAFEKPSFRAAFKKRRCLIPVTGFYEWRQDPGEARKTPYRVTVLEDPVFFLAGLWEFWPPQQLHSFTILTTAPNQLISQLHDRMPVILPAQSREIWLDQATEDPQLLNSLLSPYPAEMMGYQAYDRYVSNVRNKEKSKIRPVGELITLGDLPDQQEQASLF